MSAQPERGMIVGSRYRLESPLGEGGMAVVWKAVHTETDRAVALKIVRREFVKDDQVREMFVREARIGARIGPNPHIVDFLDAGVDATLEVPFLAMELLDGEALDARIKRDGPVGHPLAADIVEQLADALDQAHGAGVFHRDLKPQNLFLVRDKKQRTLVKVLDFGIAKLAESVQASSTHVGTPAYCAPEQLGPSWRSIAEQRGKAIATQVSAGTDVWAMGLVVYEMLIGTTSGGLWGATTLAELPVKIVLESTPSATSRAGDRAGLLPAGFDAWVARCLDLDSSKRFASAGEAAAALLPQLRSAAGAAPIQVQAHVPHREAPTREGPHREGAAAPATPAPTPPPVHTPAHSAATAHQPAAGQWAQAQSAPREPFPSYPAVHAAQAAPAPPAPVMGAPHWSTHVDPRLTAWTTQRRAELRQPTDPRAYLAWNPFQFLPRIHNVTRDVRLQLNDAQLLIAEVYVDDAIRRAAGEDRMLVALVSSPRIFYRAAIRSKGSSGLADGMNQGLKALDQMFGGSVAPTLGDPHFERWFDLKFPTPAEGNAALVMPLRHLLVQAGFRGIFELRQGGFILHRMDAMRFDPIDLDKVLDAVSRIYAVIAP